MLNSAGTAYLCTTPLPASNPTRPTDLAATIYQLLGVDPRMDVHDRLGRPLTIKLSGPVEAWFKDLGDDAPTLKKTEY